MKWFRVILMLLVALFLVSWVADAEGQIRRRRNEGVNVRAARGANVVVNQSLGGGGSAAQSAAIGGGFRAQGFRARGFHGGGIAASQAVGFGHGGFVQRQVFVPQRIQAFPLYVQPQFQVQSFAVPLNSCPIGASAFGGVGASAFAY